MNTDEFNQNAWKAQLDALFQLAGIQGDFNNKKSAFLAASMNTTFFPGQLIPRGEDPSSMPDASSTAVKNSIDSHFNQSVLDIADVLPASDTPYFTPSGNKRLAGYQNYLAWVDSGAPLDQAAYRVWQTDKKKADDLQTSLDKLLTAAQTAYDAIAAPTTDFYTWVTTSYSGRFQLQTAQKNLDQVNTTLLGEQTRALGPMGLLLNSANDNVAKGARHYPQQDGQYTMLCNANWEPFYTMNSPLYNQQYDSWTRMAADPAAPPAVSQVLDVEHADSLNYSTYGLETSKVEAGLTIFDPFFFFGEGSYSTREEKQDMFQSNNFSSIKITITCLGQPKAFTISTGDWYSSDPKTAFHDKLIAGAPDNLSDSLYPFVTQVIVGYGIGYKIELDQSSYSRMKSFHSKNTESQVVGIFGIFFEGGHTSSSSNTRSFDEIEFDENSHTITILPDKSMIPALIGVVVAKDGSSEGGDNVGGLPLTPTPAPEDLLTGDLSKFKPLDNNIDKAAIGRMLTQFDGGLNENQRAAFQGLVRRLLQSRGKTGDKAAANLPLRINQVIEKISQGRSLSGEDSYTGADGRETLESVTFKQKCGRSEVSIVVESKAHVLSYSSDQLSGHSSTIVELSSNTATTVALSELCTLLDEVDQSLKTQHTGLYLNATRQLDELVRPVIQVLASVTGVHVKGADYPQLIRPVAEMLSLVKSTSYSPVNTLSPSLFLGSVMTSGTLTLYSYGGVGKINKWSGSTPTIPYLPGATGFALHFYGRDGAFLNFTLTSVKASIRFGNGAPLQLSLSGGQNAYFWLNTNALENASVYIDVSAKMKPGDGTQVTYTAMQIG